MTEKNETEFGAKCQILAEIWLDRRDDPEWADYIAYNDLGLPLAYMIDNGIVEAEHCEIGHSFIDEGFRLLLEGMGVEDLGFYEFADILEVSSKDPAEFDGVGYDEEEIEDEEESELENNEKSEEKSDWERGWDAGYDAGVEAEQLRVQQLCSTYTEMYLDMGKGQKAVVWREVADALKPVDDVEMFSNEDYGL